MPLEVRELIIKATVGEDAQGARPAMAGNTNNEEENHTIKACVDAVLEILRQRNER